MTQGKYNYSNLKSRIAEMGYNQASLASAIGCERSTICLKINNKRLFTMTDIESICTVLDIKIDEIGKYFFVH